MQKRWEKYLWTSEELSRKFKIIKTLWNENFIKKMIKSHSSLLKKIISPFEIVHIVLAKSLSEQYDSI